MLKSNLSRLSYILDETNRLKVDKCKFKNRASVSDALVFRVDKFDPPCLQSKDCKYLKDHLDILLFVSYAYNFQLIYKKERP